LDFTTRKALFSRRDFTGKRFGFYFGLKFKAVLNQAHLVLIDRVLKPDQADTRRMDSAEILLGLSC
jgi:hypothetical protein